MVNTNPDGPNPMAISDMCSCYDNKAYTCEEMVHRPDFCLKSKYDGNLPKLLNFLPLPPPKYRVLTAVLMTSVAMQPPPEKTFLRNGVHLDSNFNKEFYTSGDQVAGAVHYDPPWGTKFVTDVKINLYGDTDADWFSDCDNSESRSGILELNINLYRGVALEKKNFPFEFKFPAHTTPTTPHHPWTPNSQFEHEYVHPLPRTWDCHCSRIRYILNAYLTLSKGKVVRFSKKLKYQPPLDTRVEDTPWREHVYMLLGFFHPGRLMSDNATESYPLDSRIVRFRFPTTLVAGEPLHGSIQVQFPTPIKSLKLWYLVIETRFKTGYRTLNRQNELTTRQCYGRVRLLSLHTITLPHDHLLHLQAICNKPVPPVYTLQTFNICEFGHLYIRGLFSDLTGNLYRLSISDLPIQIVGLP